MHSVVTVPLLVLVWLTVDTLAAAFNRMADSLEQMESLCKSLVADVAHELRTPLTSVRGYLEALAGGVLPPEKSTFDMLQSEIQRLVKLSADLLELAGADAARAYLRLEPVDLKALTGRAPELHQARFRDKGIAVHTGFAEQARGATADPDLSTAIAGTPSFASELYADGETWGTKWARRLPRLTRGAMSPAAGRAPARP